jgi:hypothetical protein
MLKFPVFVLVLTAWSNIIPYGVQIPSIHFEMLMTCDLRDEDFAGVHGPVLGLSLLAESE